MKKLIVVAFALMNINAVSQEVIITPEKINEIINYINHFESNEQMMGNISIFENGRELVNKTMGTKNDSETSKYSIGSITKLFTAVLFAQMSETNTIDLNEKLSAYFPQIPNSNKIKITQMLNHTSGLQDYVIKKDSLYFWLNKPIEKKEIIKEIIRQDVSFQPGDRIMYSNSAYYLLARILEKKLKKPFKQIVSENITKPLGLENTFGIDKDSPQINSAKSYKKQKGEWEIMEEFYFPNTSGAGDIKSNAYDLNMFMNALFTEKIIKLSTLNKMLPIENDPIGSGIMRVPFYDYIAYGHGGDTYGTHSVASYNPKNKIAVSYIINGENYSTNEFAIGIFSIIYNTEYELPKLTEYTPEKRFFEKYEGKYSAKNDPLIINISQENEQLKAQGEGQPAFILSPIEKHIFGFLNAGLEIEFKPFDNKLILKQSGEVIEFIKE